MVEKINLKERRKFEAKGAPRERNDQVGKTVEVDKNEEGPRRNGKKARPSHGKGCALGSLQTFEETRM